MICISNTTLPFDTDDLTRRYTELTRKIAREYGLRNLRYPPSLPQDEGWRLVWTCWYENPDNDSTGEMNFDYEPESGLFEDLGGGKTTTSPDEILTFLRMYMDSRFSVYSRPL